MSAPGTAAAKKFLGVLAKIRKREPLAEVDPLVDAKPAIPEHLVGPIVDLVKAGKAAEDTIAQIQIDPKLTEPEKENQSHAVAQAVGEMVPAVVQEVANTNKQDVSEVSSDLANGVDAYRLMGQNMGHIVFLVDGTGSMQPFMDSLREIIVNMLKTWKNLFRVGFNVNFVVYRDAPPKSGWPKNQRGEPQLTMEWIDAQEAAYLSSNGEKGGLYHCYTSPTFGFIKQNKWGGPHWSNFDSILGQMNTWLGKPQHLGHATGGDDGPEWLNSGLATAIGRIKWCEAAATKMILVFTDDTNHGFQNKSRGRGGDNYPNGLTSEAQDDEHQEEMRELIKTCASDKSKYLTLFKLQPKVPPHPDQDNMQAMFNNWMSILDVVTQEAEAAAAAAAPEAAEAAAKVAAAISTAKSRFQCEAIPEGTSDLKGEARMTITKMISASINASIGKSISASKLQTEAETGTEQWVIGMIEDAPSALTSAASAAVSAALAPSRLSTGAVSGAYAGEDESYPVMDPGMARRKGGRRSRLNVGRRSYKRANNKSVAKKLQRFISRKYGLRRKSIAKKF
jgi:hypothetical protein